MDEAKTEARPGASSCPRSRRKQPVPPPGRSSGASRDRSARSLEGSWARWSAGGPPGRVASGPSPERPHEKQASRAEAALVAGRRARQKKPCLSVRRSNPRAGRKPEEAVGRPGKAGEHPGEAPLDPRPEKPGVGALSRRRKPGVKPRANGARKMGRAGFEPAKA